MSQQLIVWSRGAQPSEKTIQLPNNAENINLINNNIFVFSLQTVLSLDEHINKN